ncbi:MAG: 30S ribosomal protein S16 [Candidatus Margulisbacteria bacterium]|nr:30S ribosomal protein S16 [Candidatus Margulisiibacteriota bacterium]
MSVKLRLVPKGKKKKHIYDLVAAESAHPRNGKVIRVLGRYNPQEKITFFEFNEEETKQWLSVGAEPTDTVYRLLSEKGLLPKIRRKPQTKEEKEKKEDKEEKENKEEPKIQSKDQVDIKTDE